MWAVGCIIGELFNKKVLVEASDTHEYLNSLV